MGLFCVRDTTTGRTTDVRTDRRRQASRNLGVKVGQQQVMVTGIAFHCMTADTLRVYSTRLTCDLCLARHIKQIHLEDDRRVVLGDRCINNNNQIHCLSNATHGHNINLPVCVSVCVSATLSVNSFTGQTL